MHRLLRSVERRAGITRELLAFLVERRLWWLIPMVSLLLMFGAIFIFAQSTGIAPFIYTVF